MATHSGTRLDTICLIDRYEHSPTRGERIPGNAILWSRPHSKPTGEKVKGQIAHGDEVELLDSKHYKKQLWYKVTCDKYPTEQKGWIVSTLLEEAGLKRPGIKAIDE